jgi:L-lactate dehydrogenase complex protein LldG
MEDSKSREKVLKKVRAALIQKVPDAPSDLDFDSDIYAVPDEPLEVLFAQRFSALNGKFVFCESETDFLKSIAALVKEHNWTNLFASDPKIKEYLFQAGLYFSDKEEDFVGLDVGLTFCECLVARTGTVFVSSRQPGGRRLPVYPNYHIVVAYTSQLVLNIKDGLRIIKDKYKGNIPSMISAITGPSRTADIEKTLVQGAHGPKEIYVMLIDDHK